MKFRESTLAHMLLDGLSGIEIGASAHNPFNLPGRKFNIDYTDDLTTEFKQQEIKLCGQAEPVHIVAPADVLPFPDGTWEYVISSHVLEHIYDPIGCLLEWVRVLKPGGLVFAILPHKERTFDKERPRTKQHELESRHAFPNPAELEHEGHKSVWITDDGVRLFLRAGLDIEWVFDRDDKVGNGFIIVGRKT
jgi:ubiquinone/menaquinone biosynthesis C-methylase UbiE